MAYEGAQRDRKTASPMRSRAAQMSLSVTIEGEPLLYNVAAKAKSHRPLAPGDGLKARFACRPPLAADGGNSNGGNADDERESAALLADLAEARHDEVP
jgi:hypothetical protein